MEPVAEEANSKSNSPFERFPDEVVWKIFDYVPEAVFNLRLVSQSFRARVDEYAKIPVRIALVGKLIVNPSTSPEEISLTIGIPLSKSNLFELRLRLRQLPIEFTRRIVFDHGLYTIRMKTTVEDDLKFLGESMGTHVVMVNISEDHPKYTLDIISNLLEGVRIQKLDVQIKTLSEDFVNFVIGIITVGKVDQLFLLLSQNANELDPVKFLLDVSSLVHALYIGQVYIKDVDRSSKYLFGFHDFDWAPVIVGMFSRKLDALKIENNWYQDYVDIQSANMLREQLPMTGKKIWFEATCKCYKTGMMNTILQHSVNADPSSHDPCLLRIKHLSRKNEYFKR